MQLSKKMVWPAVTAVTVLAGLAGGSVINAIQANAQSATDTSQTSAMQAAGSTGTSATTDSTLVDNAVDPSPSGSSTATTNTGRAAPDPSRGGHVGSNGTKEEVLTGDVAEKVKAAALAAVPGGTVERAETDAEGAVYEAHMKTADGKQVTVKLDANFTVTSTEDGMR